MSHAEVGPFTAHCPIHADEPLREEVYGHWPDDDTSAGELYRVWMCPTLEAHVDEADVIWRGRPIGEVLAEGKARRERELAMLQDVRWCDLCGGSRPGFWGDEGRTFRCEPCGNVVKVVHDLPEQGAS